MELRFTRFNMGSILKDALWLKVKTIKTENIMHEHNMT